jgi:prophage regulatory protein
MSGVVENVPISNPFRGQKDGGALSSRSIPKKMPRSETLGRPNVEGASNDVTFIRLPEVKAVTGLSKTTIYELIRGKIFPAPVRLSPRAVAWVKSEIRQWASERVNASRSAA